MLSAKGNPGNKPKPHGEVQYEKEVGRNKMRSQSGSYGGRRRFCRGFGGGADSDPS